MRPIDGDQMRHLEATAREIGDILGGVLKRTGIKYGFALMLFSFDGPEFTWISNAERATMVKTLQEFINRNPPNLTSEGHN